MLRKLLFFIVISTPIILLTSFVIALKKPVFNVEESEGVTVQSTRLYKDVETLVSTTKPRNYKNIENLNDVAKYIKNEFQQANPDSVYEQVFNVRGQKNVYKNVICAFGPKNASRIVIGAHYDVCQNQPGADDNASGVAGLLELVRLFGENKPDLKYRYEFVAYTLEEPPFFRTTAMGSAMHARYLKDHNIRVKAMICLEMIGYFSEEEKSQEYPSGILKTIYPSVGNFIAVIGKLSDNGLTKSFKKGMKEVMTLGVESLNAPAWIHGVDFSDHMNYWDAGFPAIMITDTAFMRNKNYHQKTDTIDTLNFDKMADVVKGVYNAILQM